MLLFLTGLGNDGIGPPLLLRRVLATLPVVSLWHMSNICLPSIISMCMILLPTCPGPDPKFSPAMAPWRVTLALWPGPLWSMVHLPVMT